MTPIPFSL